MIEFGSRTQAAGGHNGPSVARELKYDNAFAPICTIWCSKP